MPALIFFRVITVSVMLIFCQSARAHNGSIAHAYPLDRITIDGSLDEWPKNITRYPIAWFLSDDKAVNDDDFSGYFQIGYRTDNRSMYVAFVIIDNDFIEDTSQHVAWNTQDGLELCIDGTHLPGASGVASFMYSKKLRNINQSRFDPFAKSASWDIMEVVMTRKGNTRYYEWRIELGQGLKAGKTVGFDFLVFDRDKDGSFSFAGWGGGEAKYRNPNSLGDIVFMNAGEKIANIAGSVEWINPEKMKLPGQVQIRSTKNPALWVQSSIDSLGRFAASLPAGKYSLTLPHEFVSSGQKVYALSVENPLEIDAKGGKISALPALRVPVTPAPDMLPEQGILHDFSDAKAKQIDEFIETYRRYFGIPGVSLALIKDGRMVYHKTYGLRNSVSGEKVDGHTLFEAASVTKPVFAYAVQRLAERGVIDLDRPLYLYLPYEDIAYDERYKLITARHVLTHRTGFPNWRSMNPDGKLNLKFTPGTAFNYSGEGFEYLKLVVEKITGKEVEQVLQEEVIQPMGLYHTFFSKNDSLERMVSYGHYDRMPTDNNPPESPGMAYSMHTEAAIFTRFMTWLLEQKGLSAATYDTMFQKHAEYNYDPGEERPKIPTYMGMSLEIRETPYGKTFGHGGNNGDFKCKFEVYKDRGMGYVVFTNSNTSDILLESLRYFLVEGKPVAW